MNETVSTTPAPGASLMPEGMGALTAVHFVLIALVALLALSIIIAGIRRKRAAKATTREVEQRAEEAGVPPPSPEPEIEPVLVPVPEAAPLAPPERPLPDEPIPAMAPLEASPATEMVDAPAPATPSDADAPVTQLKGLGPKVAARLGELGITRVGQIAALSDDEAAAIDADLGAFSGRLSRDRWVEQARLLAAGDRAGFEAVFGRL